MNATYEAFGPSSFYQLSEINIFAPQSGRYYLAILGNGSGSYGIARGYLEAFTLGERIITPLSLISVYLWEGQNLALILAPVILAVLAGLALIYHSPRKTPFCILGTMAVALFLGWSASVLAQIAYNLTRATYSQDVFISLALAAPTACSLWSHRSEALQRRSWAFAEAHPGSYWNHCPHLGLRVADNGVGACYRL